MANRDGLSPVTAKEDHYVYDVYNEKGLVAHYGRVGDDWWKCVTGSVNEAHGFTRVHIHEAEFNELVKSRAKRLRMNVLSGKYQYED